MGRSPYSSRSFGLIDGKWKNLGEERHPSLSVAAATFVRKSGVLWQNYLKTTEELAENERDAATLLKKKARSIADKSLSFGPVVERSMTLPGKGGEIDKKNQTFELLDIETGKLVKLEVSNSNEQAFYTQIRRSKADLGAGVEHGTTPGVVLLDAIMKDISSDRWDSITPAEVVDNLHLKSNEPQQIATLAPTDGAKLPLTCVFETREGTQGILQLVGADDDAKNAKIRYKLVKPSSK